MLNENLESSMNDRQWNKIGRIGAVAAFVMLAIMITQIVIFILWPPPTTVEGFFQLFQSHKLLGLLSMDLLYIANNTLLIIFYLGLFSALRKVNFAAVLIALVLGVVGVAAYFASNTAFEMLSLSNLFAATTDQVQRTQYLAAGQGMLEIYKGTAFDTYYVLNGICLLIFAGVSLKNRVFSKTTSWFGLAAGILMSIPSTAGTLGLVFSLLSLIPWVVFSIMVAVRLLRLSVNE